MRTVAVLPVKRLEAAKQRLDDVVAPPGRRRLAEAMAGDVVEALAGVHGLDHVLIVAGDATGRALGAEHGVEVVEDPVGAGQSAAALLGIARARALEAERVLLVPGDCPALARHEVDELLAGHADETQVVIVPDRHGTGTNALLLAPPDAIVPAFGPGSRARHERAAEAAGVAAAVRVLPSLAHDVDTGGDLSALRALLATVPGRAPRTRALLARLAPAAA